MKKDVELFKLGSLHKAKVKSIVDGISKEMNDQTRGPQQENITKLWKEEY